MLWQILVPFMWFVMGVMTVAVVGTLIVSLLFSFFLNAGDEKDDQYGHN